MNLAKILMENKFMISMSESRRMVCMGIVKVNGVFCEDFNREVETGDIIEMGTKKLIVK